MNLSIQRTWKRVLSFLLVVALLIPMIPPPVFAADSPSMVEYNSLVARMAAAKSSIQVIAETYGEVDFGNGYKVNLKNELLDFAGNIDYDLNVAAAIAGGNYKDSILEASGVNNSNTSTGYTQNNFNSAFPDKYAAAVTYLKQGGIAASKYGTFSTLTYFFSYKSKLNPGYSASAAASTILGGMKESGKANIVELSENYPETVGGTALKLTAMLDMLKGYSAEADELEVYFLTLPCLDSSCENFEQSECSDWTHRILVPEGTDRTAAVAKFTDAVEKFKTDIDRDIKIAGDLATGSITSDLWFANKDGSTYYKSTAAKTTLNKMNAAIYFLDNGGYTCGSVSWGNWEKQLSYRSNFNAGDNGYQLEVTPVIGDTFTEINRNAVLPLIEATLNTLRSGANTDNLDMVYDLKVNEINGYIAKVEALRGTAVPEGGTYNQAEYDAAIESFITKAETDLHIAAFLVSGEIEESYASKWVATVGNLTDTYRAMSPDARQANALRFFNEGGYGYGYSLLGVGYQLEYKSRFHPDYSSGLFGVMANKTNAVIVMRDTAAALELGNKYMTAAELAKYKYEQSLERLQQIKDDPSAIVAAILDDDQELKQLIADLNIIIGSLDDIVSTVDKLTELGIGADILDPILNQVGLSYETLTQLAELRQTLNELGIDTSGEIDIEESMEPIVGSLVGTVIDISITTAQLTAQLGTENAYNIAAAGLNNTYDTLMDSAAKAISEMLAPVSKVVEPLRPYLNMLGSSISLVNNIITMVDQINELTDDFTAGGLSQTTYTLAYTLEDLADLMEGFGDAQLGALLSRLLENSNLGGSIANSTASLLNDLVDQMIGLDIGISGSDLGFIQDTVDTLVKQGLKNPTALVPLLRTSAEILRRAAELEGGVQDVIDGDYESAWNALTGNFGGIINRLDDVWNEIADLFNSSGIADSAALVMKVDPQSGMLSLDAPENDAVLMAFAQGFNAEAEDTFRTLCNPAVDNSVKLAKFEEFRRFLKSIGTLVSSLEDSSKCLKDACEWAKQNLSEDEAKAIAEKLARHYAEQLEACMKEGLNNSIVQQMIADVKETTAEIKATLCFIKETGKFEIIAEKSDAEGVFYTFTTNYDPLLNQLSGVLRSLGINAGYTVNNPSDFTMDGNELIASGKPADGSYQVKVAYKLSFSCSHRDIAITLGTKTVGVEIAGGPVDPEPALTGISVTKLPDKVSYTVGEALDLTGLEVTAFYSDQSSKVLDSSAYTVDPEDGSSLDTVMSDKVITVTCGEFTDTFTVMVSPKGTADPLTVTYYANNGTEDNYVYEVTDDTVIVVMALGNDITGFTAPAGKKFADWNTEPQGTGTSVAAGTEFPISEDGTVLYAQWVKDESQWHTVTFKAGANGSLTGTTAFEDILDGTEWENAGITVPGTSASTGYSFSGWSPSLPDGTGKITKDLTFTAVFEKKSNGGGGGGGSSRDDSPITIKEEEVPLGPLNMIDHYAYLQGYPDNTIRPQGNVTREEAAAVFFRLLDPAYRETIRSTAGNFSDVTPDRWSIKHISTLVKGGIFTGYPDGSFHPGAYITRAELAAIASRFEALSVSGSIAFSDISESWAKEYIISAAAKGWIKGYEDGTFKPDQYVTRAEFVTVVNNVLERKVKAENIPADAKQFSDLEKGKWYYEAVEEAVNSHKYERDANGSETWTDIYDADIEM